MKRLVRLGTCFMAVFLFALFAGCAQNPKPPQLKYTRFVGPNRVLVLLLPTIAGKGAHFEEYGFIEAVRERGFEADLKILDIKPVLYLHDRIVDIIKTELIAPAQASGYRKIILVGISLGGHGALLYATKSPQDIDGVVVLAPFMSGVFIADAIEEAGGLRQWEDCPTLEWPYACEMWHLLKAHVSEGNNRDKVIIGYGTEDGFARRNQLLARELPPGNVFTVDGGGHDWLTWKTLWVQVLDYFHVSCAETGNNTCLIEIEAIAE